MNPVAKVAIGTIVYDDDFGVDRLIQSINGYVDYHFIIEGRFPNHPESPNYDIHSLEKVIARNKIKGRGMTDIVHVGMDASEFEMRMIILKWCEVYNVDALVVLDSDEYIDCSLTNWKKFYEDISWLKYHHDSNVYGIIGYWGTDNEKPRLWINPSEMTYVDGSHKIFKNKNYDEYLDQDGCMMMSKRKITTIRFIQDYSYRSKERRDAHDEYHRWLAKHEGKIEEDRSYYNRGQ